MNDQGVGILPKGYEALLNASRLAKFAMPSDFQTGALLRTLAVTKPNARFLELGTGTGLGACWLLDGMDASSSLTSVESNEAWMRIARSHIADPRVQFILGDGLAFLEQAPAESFDFIYADTWPGKYVGFEHTLRILRKDGIIVMDDMLPQPNWPSDHAPKVAKLLREIDELPARGFSVLKMCWYTGHILITKRA